MAEKVKCGNSNNKFCPDCGRARGHSVMCPEGMEKPRVAARDAAIGELVAKVEAVIADSREHVTHVSVDVTDFNELRAALAAYKAVQHG